MVFEKLKTADAAVIPKQPERNDKVESQPGGREFLNQIALFFPEKSQDQDRAEYRQPGDDRENVVCEHVSPRALN
ncbi:MAG: hypothetical protein DMF76_21675 [Acidobacteria bacterium]|nr:MAG: hypothetical protein DMF76_21675 [Acidobacteriota bacterium]